MPTRRPIRRPAKARPAPPAATPSILKQGRPVTATTLCLGGEAVRLPAIQEGRSVTRGGVMPPSARPGQVLRSTAAGWEAVDADLPAAAPPAAAPTAAAPPAPDEPRLRKLEETVAALKARPAPGPKAPEGKAPDPAPLRPPTPPPPPPPPPDLSRLPFEAVQVDWKAGAPDDLAEAVRRIARLVASTHGPIPE